MAKAKAERKRKSVNPPAREDFLRMFYSLNEISAIANISPSTWVAAMKNLDWPSAAKHITKVKEHLEEQLKEAEVNGTKRTYREWAQATQRLMKELWE